MIHKQNGGVSSARNAGMDIATGRYIMFCDSDDAVDCHWCEILVSAAEKYPEAWAVCKIKKINSQEEIQSIQEQIEDFPEQITATVTDLYHLCKRRLSSRVVWDKIYRRDLIEKNKLRFNEKTVMGEDFEFNCAYNSVCNSAIRLIDMELYFYYTNLDSATHRYYQNWMEICLKDYYLKLSFWPPEKLAELSDEWTYEFIHMLDLVWDKRNTMSFFQKMRYNQRMLNSKEVRTCFENATWKKEGKVLKTIMNTHNYYLYWLFQRLLIIREKLL